jgi:GntR family transcriptional regulator
VTIAADPKPRYASLAQELISRIRKNYRAGDLLPTQNELAGEFGTSLITVKRALTELGRIGLVDSVRGRGTVVRSRCIADNHSGISSWTEAIVRQGIEPFTAWCKFSTRVPSPQIRHQLGLRAREKTILIERLRTADGVPTCLMFNEIPSRLAPGLAERGLDRESLYACLADRYGLHPFRAEEEVTARRATKSERSALAMKSDIVLEIRRLSRSASGAAIERATVIAPADRYQYRVTLNAAGK